MEISEIDLDMLKEVANIGAGNAASALSEMTGQAIDISVPKCEMISYAEIAERMGGADNVILGMLVQMSGDIDGYILLAQELEDARNTLRILLGQEIPQQDFEVPDYEAMREVCNIMVSTYLSAIASMMQLTIMPSVPEMTIDMAMAIMNVPVLVYGELESVLFLRTEFGGDAKSIKGNFFMMPTLESLETLKKALTGSL
ncbi:chemotaxis protein CheC [Christensenella intestinihominis]|uniref:chemotaxis protein CheC n=1 Tax=Christensenella intestinihominis TaxID=1851429 RepID=UPI00082D4CD5|nr:chemotaxis protein CheC [Christensenella intestinihominis]